MNKRAILVFVAIALAVMLPLLGAGYIQTLDMPWGPHLVPVDATKYTYPLHVVIDSLSQLVPGWVVQKIILLGVIIGAGLGAFLLTKQLRPKQVEWVYYFAGLLYVFNPFFYTRLIAGQWLVLLGYALLPWAIRSVYIFIASPKFKTAWPVAIWMAAIGLTSIHTIGIALLASLTLVIYAGRTQWQEKLKWTTLIGLSWLAINSIWLTPLLLGHSSVTAEILNFSTSEMNAFATHGTILNSPPLSAALLTGFWADSFNRYILPSQLPIWWLGAAIIAGVIITGIVETIKKRDKLGIALLATGILAWLLGIGVAWVVSKPLTELLIWLLPYYNGYREPQKWLMLLTLVYCYFAAVGAQQIYQLLQSQRSTWTHYATISLIFAAPLLFAATLPWGAANQLHASSYPDEWQSARSYLDTHTDKHTQVIVLPWHMYLPVSFTQRVVANPAGYYFNQKMITGNNYELPGVAPQNQTALTTYINRNTPYGRSDFSSELQEHNIHYVLLLKEADWRDYAWLADQSNLQPVVTNEKLILYKVERNQS